ncbi:MAG: ribonuclease HI [Thermoplasmata archaeon]
MPRGVAVPETQEVVVHFDGACQPPRGGGVSTYGFCVEGEGLFYEECGLAVRPYSEHATNNVGEYVGAIRALEWLSSRAFRGRVLLFGDSQLVIRQISGEYAVRKEHLKEYHRWLTTLSKGFFEVRFEWIPRAQNARADELSKQALVAHAAQVSKPRTGRGAR